MDPIKSKINKWLNEEPKVDVVEDIDHVEEDVMMPVTKTAYGEMVNNMIRTGKIKIDKNHYMVVYTSDNGKLTLELDGELVSTDEGLIKAVAKGWTVRVLNGSSSRTSDSPLRDLYNNVRQRIRVDKAIKSFYQRVNDEGDRKMAHDRQRLSDSITEACIITIRNSSDGIIIDKCNSIKEAAGADITIHVAGKKSWIAGTKLFVHTDKIFEAVKGVLYKKYDERIHEDISVTITDFHDELKTVTSDNMGIMEWIGDNYKITDGYRDPLTGEMSLGISEMKRFKKFCKDIGITIKS